MLSNDVIITWLSSRQTVLSRKECLINSITERQGGFSTLPNELWELY